MPISLPNLDDRRYNDLISEALALIPVNAPEWTNHNASDPGITLVELFAYITEMLIYRLNRITVENMVTFLNLIDAGKRKPDDYRDPNKLAEEVRSVIRKMRRPGRAVTAEDYEALVLDNFSEEIARVRAVPRRDLSSSSKTADAPAHISVVVVPSKETPDMAGLLKKVKDYLEPLRLLTTIVHVVGPSYVRVSVKLTLHLEPDAIEETVQDAALRELSRFFDPLTGGRDGKGWPFGRDVYLSEVVEQLVGVPGVDYVTKAKDEKQVLATLESHELVEFRASDSVLTITPTPTQGGSQT